MSKADFARIYGCDPAYVTRLHHRGKLVMTVDGKRVIVEPTLRLLDATRDLTKQGVRDRWAAYRTGARLVAEPGVQSALDAGASDTIGLAEGALLPAGGGVAGEVGGAAAGGTNGAPNHGTAASSAMKVKGAGDANAARPSGSPFQQAQTELTRAQAAIKQLELRKLSGELAEIEPMRKALVDVVTAARAAIIALPDRVASQAAAESDPAKVHVLLTAECERICTTAQRSVEQLLREIEKAAA